MLEDNGYEEAASMVANELKGELGDDVETVPADPSRRNLLKRHWQLTGIALVLSDKRTGSHSKDKLIEIEMRILNINMGGFFAGIDMAAVVAATKSRR